MTWSTLRCRQVSTWSGSGLSGVSGITTGTLPLGLRPGLPLGVPVRPRFRVCRDLRCRPSDEPPIPWFVAYGYEPSAYLRIHQTSVRRVVEMSDRRGTKMACDPFRGPLASPRATPGVRARDTPALARVCRADQDFWLRWASPLAEGRRSGLRLTTTSSSYSDVVLLEVVDIRSRMGTTGIRREVIACTVRSAVIRTAGLSTAGLPTTASRSAGGGPAPSADGGSPRRSRSS